MKTSFIDIIKEMENFTNLEKNINHYTTRNYRLDRMEKLLNHFNNPEKQYKTIHVAGSKGKGSTSKFIATSLKSLGYKVGIYASPHLLSYKERFTICGDFFEDIILIKVGNFILEKLNDFTFIDQWGETYPTTFELFTLYGYMLFKEVNCDYAVIETGLGGRLDATNTLSPEISIICPIELEHTQILGDTIEKISIEKSKIIKSKKPVVCSILKPEAKIVMKNEANNNNSDIKFLDDEIISITSHTTANCELVEIKWKDNTITNLKLQLKGKVMATNAALAILALKKLGLYKKSINLAINNTTLLGRFQLLQRNPDIYIDAAHTKISIESLVESIKEIENSEKCTIIFGSLIDKDHKAIAPIILNNFKHIILSRPGTFKKSDMNALYNLFKDLNIDSKIELIIDGNEALKRAIEITEKDGCILACGSFYLASEIAQAYNKLLK